LIGLSAAILATFFLKEVRFHLHPLYAIAWKNLTDSFQTLHRHQNQKKTDAPPMSTWELLNYPGVRQVILINSYTLTLAFAFTAVSSVFQYTPVHLGGLELSPGWIAIALGIAGGSQALWLLLVFPSLHRRVGTGGIYRICASVWPFFFAINPLCNVLLRYNQKVASWIIFYINYALGSGVAMAFSRTLPYFPTVLLSFANNSQQLRDSLL
jgi:hypothetical protein